MDLENIVFANSNNALEASKKIFPVAHNYKLLSHGYDNIVVLIDSDYAIRFPRNKNAYLRGQYEKQILSRLIGTSDVVIPKIIAINHNPESTVHSFVNGKHISSTAVGNLPIQLQDNFAHKVADFAYSMHSKLSVDEAKKTRLKLGLDELSEEPWDIYFKNNVLKYKFKTTTQDKLAKQQYNIWSSSKVSSKIAVIHDDLHTENMLFSDDGNLIGILDFGDTNIGAPEQELRSLYRINEHVLEVAIKRYEELSKQKLNIEYSKSWAIMQELAAFASHIKDNDTEHPSFNRACNNLDKWLPEGKWGGPILNSRLITLQ